MERTSDFKTEFASKLVELIELKKDKNYKLSTKRQAEEMGIPYQTFNKYLIEKSVCSAENVLIIANYYNVSTDYLLGRVDQPTTDMTKQAVCEYTGLSQKAIDQIREHQNYAVSASCLIESEEFWQMVRLFFWAKANTSLLKPRADLITLGFKEKFKEGGSLDMSRVLTVIGQSGLEPIYKQQLSELVFNLFDKTINTESENNG